jgi:hypothetical protein
MIPHPRASPDDDFPFYVHPGVGLVATLGVPEDADSKPGVNTATRKQELYGQSLHEARRIGEPPPGRTYRPGDPLNGGSRRAIALGDRVYSPMDEPQ